MNSTAAPAAVSRFYESDDGLKLHYRDYPGPADAPSTVICIPGLTRNARDFERVAQRLSGRHRVICVELRGRGGSDYAPDWRSYVPRSYVADLRALYDHLNLADAGLIGTSLGGLVSTLFAAIWPQKVRGVVLNDVGPEIDPRGLARIGSYVGKARPVVTWEDAADAVALQDAEVYPDHGPADWMRLARRRYAEGGDGQVRLDYDLAIGQAFSLPETTPEQWPFFRRLRGVPTLLVRGAESDILARETVQRMKAAAPQLQVVEVAGRGHTPSLEEPEAYDAIERFLANLPPHVAPATKATRALGAWLFRPQARRLGIIA